MNNIQMLMIEKKARLAQLKKMLIKAKEYSLSTTAKYISEDCVLIEKELQQPNLLLNKHTGAITKAAHFANTVLGEVCHK